MVTTQRQYHDIGLARKIRELHPGSGFTKEEEAELREEFASWPADKLCEYYCMNYFKWQLIFEILRERLLINEEPKPL